MMKKILIIDDNTAWINSNKEVIETAFPGIFEISIAASAKEGLILLQNYQPDLLITDLEMEKMDTKIYAGEYLIRIVNDSCPKLPIIIVSGSSDIEKIAKRNNIKYFVPKWSLLSYSLNLKLKIAEIFQIKTELC